MVVYIFVACVVNFVIRFAVPLRACVVKKGVCVLKMSGASQVEICLEEVKQEDLKQGGSEEEVKQDLKQGGSEHEQEEDGKKEASSLVRRDALLVKV